MTLLAQIREQGYALRDPTFRAVSGTIAVPVMADRFVAASIGLTWFSSVLSAETVVDRYLSRLQDVSRQISSQL